MEARIKTKPETLGFEDDRSWYIRFCEDTLFWSVRQAAYLIILPLVTIAKAIVYGFMDAWEYLC